PTEQNQKCRTFTKTATSTLELCKQTSTQVYLESVPRIKDQLKLGHPPDQRVDHCYDLMDSAYDAKEIHAHRTESGRVPIIDTNPRNRKAAHRREQKAQRRAGFIPLERVRYRERSTVERAFGRLKDEFGGRHVRRHSKVRGHLMFGVVVLTVDALLRMVH
ncbi:MAG: transposase, partial [Bacteroidetes bacterium]|nr:transposase [Bacteroidota bacterium]